ncbi:MAG: nucleotide exchange factor GrpE [Paludibacteraceae bacterium]|nr:nucleotide exchange factor GrpE [Paludibacteraceae bacterium]
MKEEKNTEELLDEQVQEQAPAEEQTADEQETESQTQAEEPSMSAEELLEKANAEIENLRDKNLRMMAEFDNFRRRTAKEKLELQKTAGERIFKDMLPLIDDFERAEKAMSQTDDIDAVRQGIELIHKKFVGFLADNDVAEIPTADVDFDTDKHEAITTFAAGEDKKGKIIDCTQKGYTLGEKVIRYAKVVVGE